MQKFVDTAKIKNKSVHCFAQFGKKLHTSDASLWDQVSQEQSAPALSALRNDRLILQQVADRLKELASLSRGMDQKVKSGGPDKVPMWRASGLARTNSVNVSCMDSGVFYKL